jgi:hypothetical protein
VAHGYFSCQRSWQQAHCTVSVGTFFAKYSLQTVQGLVITYVIALFCLWARAVRRRTCAGCVPEERIRQHQRRYSVNQLRNKSRAIVRPLCRIRCERDSSMRRAYLFCFQVSAIESCRDTAIAVAQIFPVASRKFRSLTASAVYAIQNTGLQLMAQLVLSRSIDRECVEVMLGHSH